MVKEKRILSYFLGWLVLLLFVCFVGISDVFAATYYTNYSYSQQYYDNRGSSVVAVNTTWNESLQSYVSDNITTAANSYGAGLSITSPIPLLSNHTYTLSIYFEGTNNIAKSSKSNIAISTSLDGASYNYANNNFYTETLQTNVNNNSIIQFVFKVNSGGEYIFIPWTTIQTVTQNYVITQINMEDLGSEGISQNDINNSLNNQTNILNESIQNSTNIITGEINDMQQSIIDSNKETQDVIKDQFNSCGKNLIDKSKLEIGSLSLTDGTLNNINTRIRTDYIEIKENLEYIYSINSNYIIEYMLYYDNEYLGFLNISNSTGTVKFTSGNKIKLRIKNLNGTVLTQEDINNLDLYFGSEEICTNKLDDTNDKLNDIQGALTDSSAPNTSGLENSVGWLPAGPLDSILNLPLTMLNSLTNSLGKTCAPLNLKLPYVNKNIQIPCLSAIFAQITGVNGLWLWVGTIASVLILYNYLLNLYAWVDRVLTLRAEFDEAMGADMANWGRL